MLILTYEDRPSNLTGTKLLVLSVMRQLPGVPMEVGCPGAPAEFVQWLSSRTQARLRSEPLPGKGYNVKPRILLRALDEGHEEVFGSIRILFCMAIFGHVSEN
ncbi:MAG: hypothetical protein HC898_03770 [Phycisphaerales bacterium]|nr:hypothetical protein [Phycisphaerales bacterium]